MLLSFAYCISDEAMNMNARISEFQKTEMALHLSAFAFKEETGCVKILLGICMCM